jgi:hypothetical protein
VNNVTLTATDGSGNSQNCVTTVDVQDNFGICPPPPPSCFPPANPNTTNVTYTKATLNYTAAPNAMKYIIEGGVQGGGHIKLVFNGTSLPVANLTKGTTYEWRVYTVCNNGDTSVPTAFVTFTTLNCAQVTGLNTVVNNSTSATLSWNAVPGALGYRVIGGVQGSPNLVTVDLAGNGNTTLPATGLVGGLTYNWVVYAICSVSPSIVSPQSAVAVFSTPPAASGKIESTVDPITMSVYPNPNDGKFIIELFNMSEKTTVEIYDLIGQEVTTFEVAQDKMDIDLSDREKGTYLVKVTSGTQSIVKRVIVQ